MFHSRAPRQLPAIQTMLDDLLFFKPGMPAKLAKHLGIAESTLRTYNRDSSAPRAVQLALFWDTTWGRSAADCEAHNAALYATQQVRALTDHQKRLTGIIWRLELELSQHQDRRPANLPIFNVG